jgi:predicted dehydrogenase
MRFGIVGCGDIGHLHAQLISEMPDRARLVAVADVVADSARALAAEHGATALTSLDRLCADPDVEAVSVCLPNGMHAQAAVTALRAGKHVIVEKPIDVSLEAADRICAAERESGRTVTVISQRRFQPVFAGLHGAIAAGRFGRLTSASVQTLFWRTQAYYDSADWRGTWAGEGGGALINQGSHALDLLIWMLGDPVRVSAYAGALAHERIEVEDTLAATIQFANGAIGTFSATTAAYPGLTVRMQVSGDRGSATVEHEQLQYLHLADAEPGGPDDTANQPSSVLGIEGDDSVDAAHAAQYRDFIDAVENDRAPLITSAAGRLTLEVMLASYESARRGGAAVEIASMHRHDAGASA